ncbi:Protein takeout [Frankliniella fusca]|uniref:Protein takeout n=1 Tax=Frankliniella fusca TaxID=407009 RepID=A0AAE1L7L1_9NEOP|nr:Protein takeout [Frankliniella fusca]
MTAVTSGTFTGAMKTVAFSLLVLATAASAAKIPSTWKTCVINQAHTNVCLKKSVQTALDELTVKGSPSLGVFPLDPMRISKLRLQSGSGSIALDLTFLDLDIYGFKNLRIDELDQKPARLAARSPEVTCFRPDFANNRLRLNVTITSDLVLNGNYVVKGRLLVVPINGAGRCNITLGKPVAANAEISLTKRKGADGRIYPHVEKFQFDFNPKTFKLYFHDKNHGDNQLGVTLNRIANDNSNEILRDLKPAISVAFGQAFEDIANRIFSKVPFNEVFPSK